MKVGCSLGFQNLEADWDRYETGEFHAAPPVPDWAVIAENRHLIDLVEPLGFDSLFCVEHHFSPHHITPSGTQILTYAAARTERIELGTSLIVLPWHHPVRAAEEILMLDNLLKGRGLTIGVGRGAAPREFAGLGIDQNESRNRFEEGVRIFQKMLTERHFDYEGEFYRLKSVVPRPQPYSSDLPERLFAGCTTDASILSSANLGLRPMFVGAVGWQKMVEQLKLFNDTREARGLARSHSVVAQFTYCAPTQEEAWSGARKWFASGWRTATAHYAAMRPDVWQNVKGYDEYKENADRARNADRNILEEHFTNNGLWGTPDQIIEKAQHLLEVTCAEHLILVVNPGDMPVAEAERSMRLIAAEVLPTLQKISPHDPATSRDPVGLETQAG